MARSTRPAVPARRARRPPVVALVAAVAALLAAVPVATATAAPAAAQTGPQSAEPRGWIVVDAGTGEVVVAGNAHEALPPASTVKIMTALVAVERTAPDATFAVSERAAGAPASADNPIRLQPGEQWRIADLLAILLLLSGNDAAYTIAEGSAGSLEGFADAMNAAADRFGMRDSTFNDPAGFSDAVAFDGGPRVSAYDLAIATRNAMAVPQLALLAASPEASIVEAGGSTRTIETHNRLLAGEPREYAGATGFKTGYTQLSGHTLVATATRGGRSCITVVLDTYDIYGWASQLLDQCFAATPGSGTGEHLPDVAVSAYAQRLADRDGFVRLARGNAVAAPDPEATSSGFVAPTSAPPSSVPAEAAAAEAADGDAARSDSGPVSLQTVALGLTGLLAVLVLLRRRAVRRQRARRLARRRATAAAMRRGSLPVVDGRYRAGTRVGPPVESHVRVHRADRVPPSRSGNGDGRAGPRRPRPGTDGPRPSRSTRR